MTNVINNDIKTGTSNKGYMTGFRGFAEVINKMKTKLKKEVFIGDEVSVAVDINYNKPVAPQIETGLIGVINRSQEPILRLMDTFGISEHSKYCQPMTSILDICKCYIDSNRKVTTLLSPMKDRSHINILNEQRAVQRLADIASEFNSMCISPEEKPDEDIDENILQGEVFYDKEDNGLTTVHFDVDTFYSFIDCDMNSENVGKMLQLMYESMGTNLKSTKTRGSTTNLQKVKSLNQRWFKANKNTIEKLPDTNILSRDYIFQKGETPFRILCVFKKLYGKWRFETHADEGESIMVHAQELGLFRNSYTPTKNYYCMKMTKDKKYIGTHITL